MHKDPRANYLSENLLTATQVSDLLQVSKSYLHKLVKSGALEIAFESTQGLLFLKDKVRAYQIAKNKKNALHYDGYILDILENNYFYPNEFKQALLKMQKIERIHIYFDAMDAALDGFYGTHPNKWLMGLSGAEAIRSPRLVIVDELEQTSIVFLRDSWICRYWSE